jgi:Helicase associated domain
VPVQRQAYRKGLLDPDRRARLEALQGWVWHAREAVWEEGFARLVEFVEREGHTRVPQAWSEDGYRLGHWVRNQRSRQRSFDQQRRARLEALPGWAWDKHEAFWEEGFARLVKFVEREGHTGIPAKYQEADGFRLGSWVDRNRQARRRGRLSEERARRLEALPGWVWAVREP